MNAEKVVFRRKRRAKLQLLDFYNSIEVLRWQYFADSRHFNSILSDMTSTFSQPVFFHFSAPRRDFQSILSMKNAIFSLSALLFALFTFASCEKDKQLSFEEKLPGHWQSSKVTAGGSDQTSTVKFHLNLEASKEFDIDLTNTVPFVGEQTTTLSGTWTHDDVKQEVTLTYDGDGTTTIWDVKSLDDNTMTVEMIQSGVRYVVVFDRQ
jgi:hypothetical protein